MSAPGESQRFLILGQAYAADHPALQQVLAQVYDGAQRPRCLCRDGGVEMYVARHGRYVIKRMPETGSQHHPGCPSYAPEAAQSGLGELIGDAVLETQPGQVELRVDFPWAHALVTAHGRARVERESPAEVQAPRRRMSLRAVTHFLFERAGLNRWVPAMAGKRRQGVIQKYLMEAAADVAVKGERLARRLYVPEAFNEATYAQIVKPLRYDAAHAGSFPNALLLDAGGKPVPLHVLSPFLSSAERSAKARVIAAQAGEPVWVWESDQPMPPFPPAGARSSATS